MTRIGPTAAAATLAQGDNSPKKPTPCGCSKGLSNATVDRVRQRAAMCLWCVRNRADSKTCPVDRRPTYYHITVRGCPRGYFPDDEGHIRWRFIRWIGVPRPVRDHSWRVKGTVRGRTLEEWRASFPGCGCVKILKAAWLRLKRIGGWNGHQID